MAMASSHQYHHRSHQEGPLSVATDSSSSSAQEVEETRPLTSQPEEEHSSSQQQRQQRETHTSFNAPAQEQDDNNDSDGHDPDRWVDIEDNNNNNNNNNRPRGSLIKLQVPSLLCDCVSFFRDWSVAAVEVWYEVLTAPPFPIETLQKVSIVLLGIERIRDQLEHSTLIVLVQNNNNNHDGAAIHNANTSNTHQWTLASNNIPQYLIWGIPGLIALLSVSFVLTLQLSWGHQEEAVIATALILLIFLEALLPLFILGCTSMFLFQQVSWETGFLLLVAVWLGSTFCAHCIRRMLYQSLGHG